MATKETGKKKVPVHNPFPARTAVLSGAKRSITDLYKGQKNPIAPMTKSTVLALNDQSYKAGLLAGKRISKENKPKDNPIGLNDAMDLAKVGVLGTATTIGVDIAAGQILPRLNITKEANANVYYLAKIIGAVVAGEVLSDATKGASYTGAGGAITVYMTEFARELLKGNMPQSVPLGALPQPRLVPVPPTMRMAGALAGYGDGSNVTLQPVQKQPCGCGNGGLAGVGGGIGANKVLSGVQANNEPRLFGGIKRRK